MQGCNQQVHVEKVCKNKQFENKKKHGQTVEKAKVAKECLFMVCSGLSTSNTNRLLIDNGASNHMILNESLFAQLDDNYHSRMEIGNKLYLQAVRKGSIVVNTATRIRYVNEVLFVPEITQN